VNLAFYLGLGGSAIMALSALVFFMGAEGAGEDSFLFLAMSLILVISSAGLLIALAFTRRNRGISGILSIAFSLFSFWALGGFVLGGALGLTSGIMILRRKNHEGAV
jgi:hypothetical protein